ncbi:MAG: sugar transferase [Bacteroidota bacterium]|nr:sugar transferase [Bacteroidota bacterium]
MNKKLQTLKYLIADFLSAFISWGLFFTYRKMFLDLKFIIIKEQPFLDNNFFFGIFLIPFSWLIFYTLSGTYKSIYRKSRLKELGQTLFQSIIGVTIIFFAILLDDEVYSYKAYYKSFEILFLLHFSLTFLFRLIITSITAHNIHNKIIGFNTILIGSNENSLRIYNEIENQPKSSGNKFIGYVCVNGSNGKTEGECINDHLTCLGKIDNLKNIINENSVEEVIIAIENSEHNKISDLINLLGDTEVIIKITSDVQDILIGSVKITAIFNTPLIEINYNLMPVWQQYFKRILDIIISIIAFIISSPLFLLAIIGVKLSSKGPIFYKHERIGLHGNPFMIIKFRSMYIDAEKNGPALSSKNDNRITNWGRKMRKYRIDEIPQFYNVLKGEMSLVGPRPERQYYINQILLQAPHYKHLLKVKPGITSWGQVKYGYAENVSQMIERLKYDILYVQNMSLYIDFKILIYTVITVCKGGGK